MFSTLTSGANSRYGLASTPFFDLVATQADIIYSIGRAHDQDTDDA
jgi:hypothetical protein